MPKYKKKPLLNNKLLARTLDASLSFSSRAIHAVAPFIATLAYATLELIDLKTIWTNRKLPIKTKLKQSILPAIVIGLTVVGILGTLIAPALSIASFTAIAGLIALKAKSRIQRLFRIHQELKAGTLSTPMAWRKRITTGIKLAFGAISFGCLTAATFFPPTQAMVATIGLSMAGIQLFFMSTKTLYKRFIEPRLEPLEPPPPEQRSLIQKPPRSAHFRPGHPQPKADVADHDPAPKKALQTHRIPTNILPRNH